MIHIQPLKDTQNLFVMIEMLMAGAFSYSREDIPCRELSYHSFSEGIEGIFIELNFRK